MPAITVGSVEVDVLPSTQGFHNRLRAALIPAATQVGDEVGRIIGQQIAQHITPAVTHGINNGAKAAKPAATRAGSDTGGAFARSLKARLEAAFRSMPKLDVRLSDTGVDADLARLRARLEALAGKTVGIDIDAETARAQAADIEERLRRIGAAHPNVAVRADTAAAIAQLRLLREQIDEISADPLRIRTETDGGLGARLRAAVQQAEASLPNVNIGADTTPAQVEIARLRASLTALTDAHIGVDIDAATALARITEIQTRLQRLSASDADVAVRVDAGAASAQLAAFQAQVNRLDGQTARVDVDTSSAASRMQRLVAIAVTFGPAIIPALPVVAAGLGAIAAAGVAAGVGIASIGLVAIPAFQGIGKALTAQKAAQDAAKNATYQGGQANSQGASKALQMASAQQSLATAHRNAARQVGQAEQAVGDAVRSAAEANSRAVQQVKQARQSLADAVQQAADRQQAAAEQVAQAEDSLADAQRTARQAQQDLTQARKDAVTELAELSNQVTNAQLSERDAVLGVQEAQTRLRAVQAAGSQASLIDQQRAQLAYDQAVQRLKEQQAETKSLTAEKKAADKAGVEGSDTVKAAQERLADAEDGVADQQKGLVKARQEAARQQVESQRQITEAQEKVAEASRNVSRTQEDGARSVARAQENLVAAQQSAADSISSAQRQIASASQSAAGGVDQAAIAQAKYQAELDKLSPSARETFDAFVGLRKAFRGWSKDLQPDVMPIFTRALNGLKNSLPGLTPFVKGAADAIKGLQDRASAGFKSPWWKSFKTDLEGSVKPAITGLGISFGRIFKGMAGVIQAFLPHMDDISGKMQEVTGRFADWGTGLKGSPEFERFLAYSAKHAPIIGETLGDIGGALLDIGAALEPVSGPLLRLIGAVASAAGWVAREFPAAIILLWGYFAVSRAIALGLLLWQGALWLVNAAMTAFNLISMAGPWGWIVLGIIAVVTAIYLLWTRCEWFRDAVKAVWDGIKTAGQAVVDWFSGPFVRFFTEKIPAAFQYVLSWVGRNWPWIVGALGGPVGLGVVWVIKHWDKMKAGISAAWGWIKRWVLYPIRDFFTETIPGWGRLLRDKTVAAFDAAKSGIKRAWDGIKKVARDPVQYVVDFVYNNGIRAVWNKVAGAFGAKTLPVVKMASGGVLPGYTPGRDVHKFVSPTGGGLELSGGEAIMRPEFTRAVGSGFVGAMNSIAKSRGAQGVKAALAPAFGGNPRTSTDMSLRYANGGITQRFADGGIFGWIGGAANKIAGAGSAAWNKIKEGASWLKDTLEGSARAGVKNIVDPLLKSFPGMDTGFGKMIRKIPDKILDTLFGYSKKADKKGAGGVGGPRIQAALKWARTQNGLPYQWGGNGNPSWDCSGLVSAAESVIRGQKPHRRWATGSFHGSTAPPGWVKNGNSAFKIGITNAGVGHTAGTLGKTNIESRGGDGVVVGKRARGYNDRLFTDWYGFKPGSYDSGGYLQPGLNLAYNGTGRPEPVFTSRQASALSSMAGRGPSGPAKFEGDLFLDSGEFLGKVRGEAQQVMVQGQQELISVIRSS